MFGIIITGPAKRDIQGTYEWWAANRSVEQAERWYISAHAAIRSLGRNPDRCPHALETDFLTQGIRQLNFGLNNRTTHRILFAVEGNTVVILRVRHVSQDSLTSDDLLR
jgi:plasmid stabilization system protein ParE